jgi:hypothetical protein
VIVRIDHAQITDGLTLSYGSGGNYAALDYFERILQQLWKKSSLSGDTYDGYVYTCDRNRNIRSKDYYATGNDGEQDERYTYDGLDRLIEDRRGTLDGSNTMFTPERLWNWKLDALGNWREVIDINNPLSGRCRPRRRSRFL